MNIEFTNVRQAKSGVMEYMPTIPTENGKTRNLCISEWWNGEGVDIFFYSEDKEEEKISMEYDDWRALRQLMSQFCDEEESDDEDDINRRIGIL